MRAMEILEIIGYLFAVFCSLILPVSAAIIISVKSRRVLPVILGGACFFVFQICIRVPVISYVLPEIPEYVLFQATNPLLYMLFLSLSAGVFEELGRYLVMRRFMKKSSLTDAIAFGIGHGGVEAVLLVGLNLALSMLIAPQMIISAGYSDFFYAGAERIFTVVIHICLSVIVWRTVSKRKFFGVIVAILLHGAVNFFSLYAASAVSVLVSEIIIFVFAALLLIYVLLLSKKVKMERGELL